MMGEGWLIMHPRRGSIIPFFDEVTIMSTVIMCLGILFAPFTFWLAINVTSPYFEKTDLFTNLIATLLFMLIACGIPFSLFWTALFLVK